MFRKSSRCFPNLSADSNGDFAVDIDQPRLVKLIGDYVAQILEHTQSAEKNRADLYVGDAGIAYMFLRLSECSAVPAAEWKCLQHAQTYIDRAATDRHAESSPGALLCGSAGLHAVAAVIADRANDKQKVLSELAKFDRGFAASESNDWDEILVGRAGFLSACYWLNDNLEASPLVGDPRMEKIGEQMLERGQNYGKKKRNTLMYEYHGTKYLGAAHGMCGILQMLMQAPWWFGETDGKISTEKKNLILYTAHEVLTLQDGEGNFPVAMDDGYGDKRLVHWCHGAPGAVHMLVTAYRVLHEPHYLRGARRAADLVWQRGLLRKGPGICHGVAGNAYCFLIMFRQTGDWKYMHRAYEFAKFLQENTFVREARKPDHPYSLYEGLAGTVCFLCDLLEPQRAEFPFMKVF